MFPLNASDQLLIYMGGRTDGRTDKLNLRYHSCNECKFAISLGAFAKLQKATVCLILSACLSVGPPIRSHWTDFHEIWYLSTFRKKCTLHDYLCTFMTIYCLIILRMRNISDKYCRENQNIHFLCNNIFFSPENRGFYEIHFSTFEALCTMNLPPKARPWTSDSAAVFFAVWGRIFGENDLNCGTQAIGCSMMTMHPLTELS